MSYIGRKPIYLSDTLSLFHSKQNLVVLHEGRQLAFKLPIELSLQLGFAKSALLLKPLVHGWERRRIFKAGWGTLRVAIANLCMGLYKIHNLKFKLVGVGYKAYLKARRLVLRLGFSHKVQTELPSDLIMSKIKKRPPTFVLKSVNLHTIRQTYARIRSFKKPEVYKGKGIVMLRERLVRKVGKKSKN